MRKIIWGDGVFLNNRGAGAAWKKNEEPEPEPVGKKWGAGADWKKNEEPEPEKNLPAPQPCL